MEGVENQFFIFTEKGEENGIKLMKKLPHRSYKADAYNVYIPYNKTKSTCSFGDRKQFFADFILSELRT